MDNTANMVYTVEMTGNVCNLPYVVMFTPNGYRCGFVGIDRDINNRSYHVFRIRRNILIHHRTPTYIEPTLPENNMSINGMGLLWVGFSCNIVGGDLPDYQQLLKYYPEFSISDPHVGEILKRELYGGGIHRTLDYCISVVADLSYMLRKLGYTCNPKCLFNKKKNKKMTGH